MSDISYRPRTRLVHAGQRRSHYGETSEAIYLTQGFVYPDAEAAEARFKGELAEGEEGFIYSRYGNPTVAMFEDRIAALEGAEAAFATASGMAAVNAALMCQLKAGDHVVAARALFGSCLCHARRRHRPGAMARGDAARDQGVFSGNAIQSDARDHRREGGRRDRP
jgi:cystathionine beta-lyase/cystathionine gamma-synthase